MKPETVLNLKTNDNPESIRDKWLREYKAYADEFTNTEELASLLSDRVNRAYTLICERSEPDCSISHDEAFYEENSRRIEEENAELDGDFPLGNEQDAAFAGAYFPISDLVSIQLGYEKLINCGYYTEYNYAVLVRKGFLAEMNGEWLDAARCYEGVSGSKAVQDREYACRRRAKEKGEQLYTEAQKYMESGEWSAVYYPLQCAADMGNTDAMTDLGLARIYGQFGCAKDTDEALGLLRQAAASDNPRAAFGICELYDDGIDIDAHEAMIMCEKAAALGYINAEERLKDGFDLRPAREILQEQIDNGNINAIWYMEQLCEREQDSEGAAYWLDKAVAAGQTDALLKAAEIYTDCHDKKQADRCLRRAADAGSVRALMLLGDRELTDTTISFWDAVMLMNHPDEEFKKPKKKIEKQHKNQFIWYERAAQSGDLSAISAICNSYFFGYPVKRDYEKAFMWASHGAKEDDPSCIYISAYLYENGFGVGRDIDKAIALYIQAADTGVQSAIIRLYQIYSAGLEHISADAEKAARYLFLSGEGRS